MSEKNETTKTEIIPKGILWPFILVTLLFPLWGFANDITNPMVAAFKKILLISNFESSWVQAAFYGGYCVMSIPAALFIKRFSYKSGILLGLLLYSAAALFFPIAGSMMSFWAFLSAYFVMTCGLSFLETSANPYILSMGPEETATQRLNFAQSFNPMGSLVGMFVAMTLILNALFVLKTDADLAPQVAIEAQARIAQIASAPDLDSVAKINADVDLSEASGVDDAKWKMITSSSLNSWIGSGAGTIVGNIKSQTPVDWTSIQQQTKSKQDNLPAIVAILKDKDTTDAAKWDQIQSAGLGANLSANAQSKITDRMAAGKDVKWMETALLDGAPDEEQARRLFATMNPVRWNEIQKFDLKVLQKPYFAIGIVIFSVLLVFAFTKLPRGENEGDNKLHVLATLKRLSSNHAYLEGVIAQAFYVGAQIMCWTFIIQYANKELGMEFGTAQGYNIVAMIIFVSSRFICTFLLKYICPGALLRALAAVGLVLIMGVIFIKGMAGLYCLVAVSACMSLMFPTIYGIALRGLGDDAKLGAAGLIMAIGGGCLMPPMQAAIFDMEPFNLGFMVLSSARASFILPAICFAVIVAYGWRTVSHLKAKEA